MDQSNKANVAGPATKGPAIQTPPPSTANKTDLKPDVKTDQPTVARNGQPVTVSNKVKLMVVISPVQAARIVENSLDPAEVVVNVQKVGGSMTASGSTAKGLNPLEEIKYMPSIIGVAPSDNTFQAKCVEYWKNIGVVVSAKTGLELEVGFIYPDGDSAKRGDQEDQQEWETYKAKRKIGQNYRMSFDVRQNVGTPINVENYVLYRYLLIYNQVANTKDEIGLSKNIRFYLTSENQQLKELSVQNSIRRKANARLLQLITDDFGLLRSALSVFTTDSSDFTDVHFNSEPERIEEFFYAQISKNAQKVFDVLSDKRLELKSIITRSLNAGLLRRLPNSSTIMYEEQLIGNNLDEAAVFIGLAENTQVLNELEVRLNAFS